VNASLNDTFPLAVEVKIKRAMTPEAAQKLVDALKALKVI
jgi:hypothetical protein